MTDPKQIPFDWDEYERTCRPVFTRSGQPVTQLTKFDTAELYPLRGVVDGRIHSWKPGGYAATIGFDLVFHTRTETRSVWVNVYPNSTDDHPRKDRRTADLSATSDRIDCIELTYEVEVP